MVRTALAVGVQIRVGIHTGEVEFIGDNARGVAVHAAARVLAVAGADEASSRTRRAPWSRARDSTSRTSGVTLKGLEGERQLYRLTAR